MLLLLLLIFCHSSSGRCFSCRSMASLPPTFFLLVLCFPSTSLCCTEPDRESLLFFLSNLTSQDGLPRWGTGGGDQDCCRWDGVTCNNNQWVTHLSLPFRGLEGQVSPSLGNLTHLIHLNLSHNSFSGKLPASLLWSKNLVSLDLSFNRLCCPLPPKPANRQSLRLQTLNLSGNSFLGPLPSLWGVAPDLESLNISYNRFSGPIPPAVCDTSHHLRILDISHNQLTGSIPEGLGNCSELAVFQAGFNNLSGQIPSDLYDAVSLQQLSLQYNQIQGTLDGKRIANLTNLSLLHLWGNHLTGMLPDSIGKLSNLKDLLLYSNNLTGPLPSTLRNCTRLRCLNLRENNLNGDISAIDFSTLLDLKTLDLGNNKFTGNLPASIYSCKSLIALRLAKNALNGRIAPELANLQALSYLSLSANKLEDLSKALQILDGCKNLTIALLSGNFLEERIPVPDGFTGEMDILVNLRVLSIANSRLTGQVPFWLSKLQKLEVLDLSLNQLTGPLPGWLGSLPHLFYLDLSHNKFSSGEFPQELTALKMLTSKEAFDEVNKTSLDLPVFITIINSSELQYNKLSSLPPALYLSNSNLEGVIPPEIGRMTILNVLDLSCNNLSGEIPEQISNLSNLETLNLSRNHLSGTIPPELSRLHFLSKFSVAYNYLWGSIPSGGQFDSFQNSSFEGNPNLCGLPVMHNCTKEPGAGLSNPCKSINKKLIVGITLGVCLSGALALTLLVLFMLSRRRERISKGRTVEKEDSGKISSNSIHVLPHAEINSNNSVVLFPSNSEIKNLVIPDILKATDNFNDACIIGCGGFGLVYKATLLDGTTLAIKKLMGDMGVMEREFKAEVEALSNARHKNLVTLQGYYIQGGFRLLIYSYMKNGSLDYWLHERDDGPSILDWPTRLRIAQGSSRGLAYIHQVCEPRIVHRDIKSSNILLDQDFEAHVADFGLSRLILPANTHVTTELVGTLGYIPPEYGQAWVATLRGDIYSFGVVMLELLTGRRPFEVCKPKQSRELVEWVQQMRSQSKHEEIFDPLLKDKGFEEQMLQVLDVACLCVNTNPIKRPTIKEVVGWLDNVGIDTPLPK